MQKIDVHLDFETFSEIDLKVYGTVKYVTHPSTCVTLLTWAFSRVGQLQYWMPGMPIPSDLMDVILNPHKYNVIAWNVLFDFLVWNNVFIKNIPNSKPLTIADVTDAMALSNKARTGSSLEACAKMFELGEGKDKEGSKIMKLMMKPTRYGTKYQPNPAELTAFIRYGMKDTDILRKCYYRLPPLPWSERWIWEWTMYTNIRGISIDAKLVNLLNATIQFHMPYLENEFAMLTGGHSIGSRSVLKYFQKFWPEAKNLQKATLRELDLNSEGKPAHVIRALQIKREAGSSSIAKAKVAAYSAFRGKLYALIAYAKAQTIRFAGMGIQIHNFPRLDKKQKDFHLLKNLDLNKDDITPEISHLLSVAKDPIGVVKNLLRRIWIPDPGQSLYQGDFSKVEPTVLRWLLGLGPISKQAYEEMASVIYGVPVDQIDKESEERQVGKASVLGGGYGMGFIKFRGQVYEKEGIRLTPVMAYKVIKTYRQVNKEIVQLWSDLENAFKAAIRGIPTSLCDGKIYVSPMVSPLPGVQIRLPSGSHLYYPRAHTRFEQETNRVHKLDGDRLVYEDITEIKENIYYQSTEDGATKYVKIYGGLLTEHVTSATSRDVLTNSLYNLSQENFDCLINIHDEQWAQSYPGRCEFFKFVMEKTPHWCKDLPLEADVAETKRYLK